MYIDELDDIVNKYNDKYHSTIKTKPKFKIVDIVRILKYENIFVKGYVPNWSEEVFLIKKVGKTIPWTYVISDLKSGEIFGTFFQNELQKTNLKEFRLEKVIKKVDNLHVKWKGYDSSFNNWIDKKDIVL